MSGEAGAGRVEGRAPGLCLARGTASEEPQAAKRWRGAGCGKQHREVLTRSCCLVAQIVSALWLLRGIWPLGFAFSFIYFCLFSILFVNTNILSHSERFLPSSETPSSCLQPAGCCLPPQCAAHVWRSVFRHSSPPGAPALGYLL